MTTKAIIMTVAVALIVAALVFAALALYVRTHKRCGCCRSSERRYYGCDGCDGRCGKQQ